MRPSSYVTSGTAIALAILVSACADTPVTPPAPGALSGTGSAVAQSGSSWGPSVPLTPGFDIFTDPLTKGKVIWKVPDGQRRLNVTFILDGALPGRLE
jgi:hypothetical protein